MLVTWKYALQKKIKIMQPKAPGKPAATKSTYKTVAECIKKLKIYFFIMICYNFNL